MSKNYEPPETLAEFMLDESFVRAAMGPLGSGKSTACVFEIVRRSMAQQANRQGVRRSKWVVIRNTYQQLRDTALQTWLEWFPDGPAGTWRAMDKMFMLRLTLSDGTKVEADVLFRALDRPDDTRNLLSLELTGGWVNEYREVPFEVVMALTGRVGRFPSGSDGVGCTWSGIIMDSNPPDVDSPYYRVFEEPQSLADDGELNADELPEMKLWKQPGGLSAEAENLIWLNQNFGITGMDDLDERRKRGRQYYVNMQEMARREGRDQSWIDVHVHGKYGFIMDGRGVYGDDFALESHIAKSLLVPIEGRAIVIGADFGLTPAAVWGQQDAQGRWFILGEMVCEDMAADTFGKLLMAELVRRYGPQHFLMYGDPAGQQRSQADLKSCFDVIRTAGFTVIPSEQSPTLRISSVRAPMRRMVSGSSGFKVDQRCSMLIRGFQGGYQYRRMKVSGERYTDKPDKNKYSHVHDALQYLMAPFEGPGLEGAARREWPDLMDRQPRTPVIQMEETNFWG